MNSIGLITASTTTSSEAVFDSNASCSIGNGRMPDRYVEHRGARANPSQLGSQPDSVGVLAAEGNRRAALKSPFSNTAIIRRAIDGHSR